MNPVSNIVYCERPHKTRKTCAEFFERWIEFRQAVRLPRNVEGRLGNLRALPDPGEIEVWFCGAVIVQGTVKSGTLKFSDIMLDII